MSEILREKIWGLRVSANDILRELSPHFLFLMYASFFKFAKKKKILKTRCRKKNFTKDIQSDDARNAFKFVLIKPLFFIRIRTHFISVFLFLSPCTPPPPLLPPKAVFNYFPREIKHRQRTDCYDFFWNIHSYNFRFFKKILDFPNEFET